MGEWIEIAALSGEGSFRAYRAVPVEPPRAAIIVIQEIFGVNAGIRRKADDWAEAGYLAIAPDMFWRFAPGYDVNPDIPEQMADAFEVRKQFDLESAARDVEAAIRSARAAVGDGKVGIVGFCMGGSVAWLAATRTDIDASVAYYGGQIGQYLGEAHAIARPVLLHFAGDDAHIPVETIATVRTTLASSARAEVHEYAGVGHGFADTFGKRRNDAAAETADARTRAFFAGHLR